MQFSTVGLIYDAALVILVIVMAFHGKKQGFLSGVVNLLGMIAGVIGAILAVKLLAKPLYDHIVGIAVANQVSRMLSQAGGELAVAVQSLDFLSQSIRDDLLMVLQTNQIYNDQRIVAILEPFFLPLCQGVVFFLSCIIIRALFFFLDGVVRGLAKLPLVGTADKALGFAFGALTGVLDVWLACIVLWILALVTQNAVPFLSLNTLATSNLYSLFSQLNPFLM